VVRDLILIFFVFLLRNLFFKFNLASTKTTTATKVPVKHTHSSVAALAFEAKGTKLNQIISAKQPSITTNINININNNKIFNNNNNINKDNLVNHTKITSSLLTSSFYFFTAFNTRTTNTTIEMFTNPAASNSSTSQSSTHPFTFSIANKTSTLTTTLTTASITKETNFKSSNDTQVILSLNETTITNSSSSSSSAHLINSILNSNKVYLKKKLYISGNLNETKLTNNSLGEFNNFKLNSNNYYLGSSSQYSSFNNETSTKFNTNNSSFNYNSSTNTKHALFYLNLTHTSTVSTTTFNTKNITSSVNFLKHFLLFKFKNKIRTNHSHHLIPKLTNIKPFYFYSNKPIVTNTITDTSPTETTTTITTTKAADYYSVKYYRNKFTPSKRIFKNEKMQSSDETNNYYKSVQGKNNIPFLRIKSKLSPVYFSFFF
jgi:hypothetical protein